MPISILGNNVLAQVPDLNDFVGGRQGAPGRGRDGDVRVPALATLLEHLEYDTIYHEHFSYFSLIAIREIFGAQGLSVVDVEEMPTHGGSLRVFFASFRGGPRRVAGRGCAGRARGRRGLRDPETYRRFESGGSRVEARAARAPDRARSDGKQVVGYGAPGKGNTLLNYCGIRTDLLDYTVDRNPYKQGKLHARDAHPDPSTGADRGDAPDLILILPWNLAAEISAQLAYTADWGAQLVVPIPTATVFAPGTVPDLGAAR